MPAKNKFQPEKKNPAHLPVNIYKNNDMAQYTKSKAIIVFVMRAYLENINLNTEPKIDMILLGPGMTAVMTA